MRQPKAPLNIAQLQRGVRYGAYPEPNFFRLRLVRHGPWVPALIWRPCPFIAPVPLELTPAPEEWCTATERPRLLRATIGDEPAEPLDVWERGTIVPAREWHLMMRVREWAMEHAPGQPEAQPRRRVDLREQPPLF